MQRSFQTKCCRSPIEGISRKELKNTPLYTMSSVDIADFSKKITYISQAESRIMDKAPCTTCYTNSGLTSLTLSDQTNRRPVVTSSRSAPEMTTNTHGSSHLYEWQFEQGTQDRYPLERASSEYTYRRHSANGSQMRQQPSGGDYLPSAKLSNFVDSLETSAVPEDFVEKLKNIGEQLSTSETLWFQRHINDEDLSIQLKDLTDILDEELEAAKDTVTESQSE
jgi:hypothetical protein